MTASADLSEFLRGFHSLYPASQLTATRRVQLDDPHQVHLIQQGQGTLFLRHLTQEGMAIPMADFKAGDLLFGFEHPTLRFEFVGDQSCEYRSADCRQGAIQGALRKHYAARLDQWLTLLLGAWQRMTKSPQPPSRIMSEAALHEAEPEDWFTTRGELQWLEQRHLQAIAGSANPWSGQLFPLATDTRVQLTSAGPDLILQRTEQLLSAAAPASLIAPLHDWLVQELDSALQGLIARERTRLNTRADLEQSQQLDVWQHLRAAVSGQSVPTGSQTSTDTLLGSFAHACRWLGVTPRLPAQADSLPKLAQATRLRYREVLLGHQWWSHDAGAVLAFMQEDGRAVCILPDKRGRMRLHDGLDVLAMTESLAAALQPRAYVLYRPLPAAAIGLGGILAYALRFIRSDLSTLMLTAMAGGLIALAVPIATAYLFDTVVPQHERGALLHIGLVLLVLGFCELSFDAVGAVAFIRMESHATVQLQAAIIDRVLRLPLPFLNSFAAGDLVQRAMGIDGMREALTGVMIRSFLGGLFSIFSLALMFSYSVGAALVGLALGLFYSFAMLAVGWRQLIINREVEESDGKLSALNLDLISGFSKWRLSGAESRGILLWSRAYVDLTRLNIKAGMVEVGFSVFSALYTALSLAVMFFSIAMFNDGQIGTGSFLALLAAFTTFNSGLQGVAGSLMTIIELLPTLDRAKPLLSTLPEVTPEATDPGEIGGSVVLRKVVFRYGDKGPTTIDAVDLRIAAGESVAIVGASGSGKSTLLKLILGFAVPQSGAVLYDGKELGSLDQEALRSQIGVVLQQGQLMAGSVYEVIRGPKDATIEQAWDAAQIAGIAEDIEAMPMGMHTVVGEGSSSFSGGQVQRLMIARAIVGRPKILLLDEATSALDNRVQAEVMDNLSELAMTRIAIAHRLSTVVDADRLIVMEQGRVVESGTYQDLLRANGLFARLAARQALTGAATA